MGKFVATLTTLKINSVDLSNHVESAVITEVFDEVEVTAFGGNYHDFLAGLTKNTLTVTFQQDYGISSVNQTLFPLVGTTTTFSGNPTGAANSTVNPSFSGTILVSNYTPIDASVGALGKISATWPITSAITQATT